MRYILFFFALLACLSANAKESWVPSFFSDYLSSGLENGSVYRAHISHGVYADLEFEEGEAYITLVSVGRPQRGQQKLAKDGFKISYSRKDSRLYFDGPIPALSLGTLGLISDDFSKISFQSVTQDNDVYFHKIFKLPAEGIYRVSAMEKSATDEWQITNISDAPNNPVYLDLNQKFAAYEVIADRKILLETAYSKDKDVLDEEQIYWIAETPAIQYLVGTEFRRTYAMRVTADKPTLIADFLSEGFEILSTEEYDQLLVTEEMERLREEERLASLEAERKKEEERLALEAEKKKAETERREREIEEKRIADRKRAEDRMLLAQCINNLQSNPTYSPRAWKGLRNEVYETLAEAQQHGMGGDWQAGKEVLQNLLSTELTKYEEAHVYNSLAYIAYALEDYSLAIDFYHAVLRSQPGIPYAMENGTTFTIIQLYLVTNNIPAALDTTYAWCNKPYATRSSVVAVLRQINSILDNELGLNDLASIEVQKSPGEEDYALLIAVDPLYPPLANKKGISGTCTVTHTVTATGMVKDPHIENKSDCSPKGYFERSSLQTVKKFKYKPRVRDGQGVEVTDVKHKFTYEFDGRIE